MKFPIELSQGDPIEAVKALEDEVADVDVFTDFEGDAIFAHTGRIITNAAGEYVLKEGTKHVLNISRYLSGKTTGIYGIDINRIHSKN